ncbi:hypothetical protein [Ancylobacter sp. TS-1]|uniref:hypothetical protein n=1 Tax=Ancylobacter sp. TS-1 TaxID=1850374 RepID=UPI001265BB26|nr:hypothetical protein [Ancylobacter sp. TS-1]QFR32248.1 hypothetical protein GBB76_03470 [Ancylobacter sp. TS-1]
MASSDLQDDVPGWLLDDTVGPDAKLRQGDLIVFERSESPLRKVGIIVTADCDLELRKHARLVTLVPVVDARTVLERYLLFEDCERKRDIIETYLFKAYSINVSQERATKLTILRQTCALSDLDGNDSRKVAADFVFGASDSIPVEGYVKLMRDIGSGPKGKNALRDQIRGRGDLLMLPSTQKLGIAGHIAWLRHIWQVGLDDIALRTSEVGARPGERLGRLDSPFRYRLTQLMAQVFSDIGLPNIPDGIDEAIEEAFGDA